MVSGQSLVLYSRLHLVVRHEEKIRWVLYLIIFNAIVIGIPDMILAFLTMVPGAHASVVNAFTIFDKIQVGIFTAQEFIISGLYIFETVQLLGPSGDTTQNPYRQLLTHLILVNILVLVFDATLLGTEYSGNFEIQTTYKPAIYSIKLKIEFSVLNRLISIVKKKELALGNSSHNNNSHSLHDLNNTLPSTLRSGSLGDIVKDNQQPSVNTTELVLGSVNWNNQTITGRRNGEIMQTSASDSQIQLSEDYQHA